MAVKRIVANLATPDPAMARAFYCDILGLEALMDQGWIVTLGNDAPTTPQVSFATQGGSDAPVPDLSIEVDNFDEVLSRVRAADLPIPYGPITEPWGVRRFFTSDPFGRLVNILEHVRL